MSENTISRQDAKVDQWERKLLDLTTRNALLNVRLKGNMIPLFVTSASDIEDSVYAEEDYIIISRSTTEAIPAKEYGIEDLEQTTEFDALIEKASSEGQLYSSLTDKELEDKIKALYRNSKTALEEDGAGTLFLACGLLKWIDEKKDNSVYYAPIVLVPVELVRKFGVGKYVLRKTDDDAIMNRSLVEKLKRDFDIDISELDGEIRDEENGKGKDVAGVFETLSAALETKEGWKVIDACVLGMFSFSKFVMWNDLRQHREELASNEVVRSLMEGRLAWTYENMEERSREFKGDDSILLPISADNSQLYAIQQACGTNENNHEPKSFVLHGPPGTGKSQTITTMIANAIANGKTVLFAAEKKAALDVVYSRLSKIGLAPFSLELHSNKIRKGWVLDQLKEALEYKTKNLPASGYDKALEEIQKRRDELDIYADALSEATPYGYSLYEMLCIYSENSAAPDIVLADGYDEGLTEDAVEEAVRALEEYIAISGETAGVISFVGATEYSQEAKVKLPAELDALLNGANNYESKLNEIRGVYPSLVTGGDIASADGARAKCENFLNARKQILQTWEKDFLAQDADALLAEYTAAEGKWGPLKNISVNKVYNKVKAWDKSGNAKDDLGTHLKDLSSYKSAFSGLGFNPAADVPTVIPEFIGASKEYDAARDAVNARLVISELDAKTAGTTFERVRGIVQELRQNEGAIREKTIVNKAGARCRELKLTPLVRAYEDNASAVNKGNLTSTYMKAWSKLLICKIIDDTEVLRNFSGKVFDERVAKLKELSEEFRDITKQEIILKVAKRIPDFNIEANHASILGKLQRAIKSRGRGISIRTLFRETQEIILKLTPCVLMSPISAAQFIAPSKEPLFDLVIFDEASQLPTCEAIGAIARGKHAIIVGDPMQMPPTAFFKDQNTVSEDYDTEDLESILDDCLAVGMPQTRLLWHYRSRHESLITFSNRSFYDSKLYTFPSVDDRASRITMVKCDGVFDSGKTRTNEVEAKAVTAELVARSKDPGLSKLTYGVVTFNIQQQNLIEDMIDDVCRQDEEFEKWAFGREEPIFIKNLENVQGDERDVILFSVNYGPDEEGKVSMNFGPINKDGGWRRLNVAVTRSRCEMKVFSSLPAEKIKTTESSPEGVLAFKRFLMYAEQNELWDSDLTPAPDAGNSTVSFVDITSKTKGIKESIRDALAAEGYSADIDIGKSGYKVDIGVVDPDDPQSYCLGILIDGSAVNTKASAATREIEQPAMLRSLGWNVIKIWSMEWWEDPKKVIAQCIDAINNRNKPDPDPEPAAAVEEPAADEAPVAGEPAVSEESPAPEETQKKTELNVDSDPAVTYAKVALSLPQMTNKEFCDPINISALSEACKTIVETESPICFDVLVERLTEACGITRKTADVKERCEYLVKALHYPTTMLNLAADEAPNYDKVFVWKNAEFIGSVLPYYRFPEKPEDMRDCREITLEEASCAAIYLARSQFGMPIDNLIEETGRTLGFKANIPMVKNLCERAINHAIEIGELEFNSRIVK